MVPPSLIFWSISRKKSLEFQQRHALRNRFWRTILCSDDILNAKFNRLMLTRNKQPFLTDFFFDYEQLFHAVQFTACWICQCSWRDKFILPKVTDILSILEQLLYLWGINCFGNSTRQYSTCLYQCGSLHIFFSNHHILSFSGNIFLFWFRFFNVWQLLLFNYSQCKFFGRLFWSFKYK